MFSDGKVTEIFLIYDKFSKVFDQEIGSMRKLQPSNGKRKREGFLSFLAIKDLIMAGNDSMSPKKTFLLSQNSVG